MLRKKQTRSAVRQPADCFFVGIEKPAISCAIAEGFYGTPTVYRGTVLKRLPPDLRGYFSYDAAALENWRKRDPKRWK